MQISLRHRSRVCGRGSSIAGRVRPDALGVMAAVLAVSVAWSPPAWSRDQKDKLVNDFGTRVTQYLELRQRQAHAKPSSSSEKVVDQQQQLAANIQATRANAKQGDIFAPEIAKYFRRQIASVLGGKKGEKVRSSLRGSEPLAGFELRVNQSYPHGIPLQTTPPSLLQQLPVLPKELEYRIVGHDLVLHDIEPNIIVDFIHNAISTP